MSDIGDLLRKIRGKDALRAAAKKTGLSHGYISILEKGSDPRTGSPINPSPETLRSYSKGYNYPFEHLMEVSGYSEIEQDNDNKNQESSDKGFIESEPNRKILLELVKHIPEEDLEDFIILTKRFVKNI